MNLDGHRLFLCGARCGGTSVTARRCSCRHGLGRRSGRWRERLGDDPLALDVWAQLVSAQKQAVVFRAVKVIHALRAHGQWW